MDQAYSFIFNAWNSTVRLCYLTSPGEKDWLCTELEERERALPLGMGGFSRQARESQSTANQLLVQIQELQDKVTSQDDSREF